MYEDSTPYGLLYAIRGFRRAPNSFPPKAFRPGSVGDKDYTPLVRIENAGNHIYNAPIVAFDVNAKQVSFCNGNPDYSLVHDKVVKICLIKV
jgi:hypothetical protein